MDTPTTTPPPKDSPIDQAQAGVKRTNLGTPCAKSWDAPWIERVNEREATYNRPICGARTRNDTPCPMAPNHANGRCKFHGGFPLTGAPKGNRNAVLHGLYSRRLQLCGEHCPQWNSCPLAGKAVADVPYKERPHCPYEETEYTAVLTDHLRRIDTREKPDPTLHHLAHQVALFQVMTSRAAAALRSRPLTETTRTEGENYSAEFTKVSATLQAFTRLATEFRRFHHMLDQSLRSGPLPCENTGANKSELEALRHHCNRLENDTDPNPEAQAVLHRTPNPAAPRAGKFLYQAAYRARFGEVERVIEEVGEAHRLDPLQTAAKIDGILEGFNPKRCE